MIYPVFSIRDSLNGFGQPMLDTNEVTAMRNFKNAVAGNVNMQNNLNDFDLYQIGTFNTDDGALIRLEPIKMIMSAGEAFGGM